MNSKNKTLLAVIAVALFSSHTLNFPKNFARADESDIKNAAEDVKTDTKKGVRKIKRKVRKAMGTNTAGQTVHDKFDDAKDDIGNSAKKTKNKIEN